MDQPVDLDLAVVLNPFCGFPVIENRDDFSLQGQKFPALAAEPAAIISDPPLICQSYRENVEVGEAALTDERGAIRFTVLDSLLADVHDHLEAYSFEGFRTLPNLLQPGNSFFLQMKDLGVKREQGVKYPENRPGVIKIVFGNVPMFIRCPGAI